MTDLNQDIILVKEIFINVVQRSQIKKDSVYHERTVLDKTTYEPGFKSYKIARKISQSHQSVYNIVIFLKERGIITEYFD